MGGGLNWTEEQLRDYEARTGKRARQTAGKPMAPDHAPVSKESKYHAKGVWVDGLFFPSQLEAGFYCQLKLMLRAGEIDGFCRQARFVLAEGTDSKHRGVEYVVDFIVLLPGNQYEIVDTKGMQTDVFRNKLKLMRERYPKINVKLEG